MRQEWLDKDYYAVLGVDRTATARDIKKAFRTLAQEHHPDSNPDDPAAEARFKDISEAHSVLGDEEQRAEYDQVRDTVARGGYMGGPGGNAQYVRFEDVGDIGDLFSGFGGISDLFGGGGRMAQRGADLEAEVSLTFHEAIEGATRSLSVDGRNVTVKIPAGINNGARIRLRGKGQPGANGGGRGDLFVRVRAGSHPIFRRSGRNLKVNVPVTYTEAALGADIKVPTLDGVVTLKVPKGTASGKTLRVSGKGVTTPQGTGDLLVRIEVQVPATLSDPARETLEQLRELESDQNPRSHLGV